MGRSSTAATFQSRCACLPAALLVVCYPERCDELSRVGVYSHPWKYDARRAPTTNKSPPSRAARLVGSRIIEDHISVGQARNIANADKVCGAPLQRLAHMDAQRLACFFSHLARREGLKFELQRRQDHAHAMGQRQLPQCPSAPLLRVADMPDSAVAVALVASILASRAVTGTAAQMCDGVGWRPIIRRVSDSRSRLTAGFATGVPCAQPGLDLENECAFQVFARSAQASARRRASRRATGCWPFVTMSLRRGRQQTTTRELELCPLLGRQLPCPPFCVSRRRLVCRGATTDLRPQPLVPR